MNSELFCESAIKSLHTKCIYTCNIDHYQNSNIFGHRLNHPDSKYAGTVRNYCILAEKQPIQIQPN